MSIVNTRITSLSLSGYQAFSVNGFRSSALVWIKSFFPIYTTVEVQAVRNYMNFITCEKSRSWQIYCFVADWLPLNRFQHF